jgi:D-alanyl-D-alanine carboxypeptidase
MTMRFSATIPVSLMLVMHSCAFDHVALEFKLQKVMDEAAKTSKDPLTTGFSLGVSLPEHLMLSATTLHPGQTHSGIISLGSGHTKQDPGKGKDKDNAIVFCGGPPEHKVKGESCVQSADMFAMGSTAKMYTAAAVLRLVDQGKFDLDDKALPLFDQLWTKLNGSSIVHALGPQIKDVTVRQLLQMQSGIPDFDNDASRQYQFDHPVEDLGPVKEMSFVFGKNFSCTPGTCGQYSSSNYELLGLLLAQQAGKQSWDDYSQAEGLPVFPEMTSTVFAVHGPCSQYTSVHGYSNAQSPPVDVFDVSCTNGWTCGNLISNAADAAFFVRALLGKGERILTSRTQSEMFKFKPLTRDWSTGLPYGLGIMDIGYEDGMAPGEFVGHGGETYGFNAFTAYVKSHDFGISVVANSENTNITKQLIANAYSTVVQALSRQSTPTLIV